MVKFCPLKNNAYLFPAFQFDYGSLSYLSYQGRNNLLRSFSLGAMTIVSWEAFSTSQLCNDRFHRAQDGNPLAPILKLWIHMYFLLLLSCIQIKCDFCVSTG